MEPVKVTICRAWTQGEPEMMFITNITKIDQFTYRIKMSHKHIGEVTMIGNIFGHVHFEDDDARAHYILRLA
jgi:hypothetical protein